MQATLTLDGICFLIENKGKDIAFELPSEGTEEVHLSPAAAAPLASVLMLAVQDAEKDL